MVPKRNIETWIYALDTGLAGCPAGPLDEQTAYRKLHQHQTDCAAAARAFADHEARETLPAAANEVPSLRDGLSEFARLKL